MFTPDDDGRHTHTHTLFNRAYLQLCLRNLHANRRRRDQSFAALVERAPALIVCRAVEVDVLVLECVCVCVCVFVCVDLLAINSASRVCINCSRNELIARMCWMRWWRFVVSLRRSRQRAYIQYIVYRVSQKATISLAVNY